MRVVGGRPVSELPRKIYYTITEVAEMAGVKAHVLRYWETEFPALRPRKNRAGNAHSAAKEPSGSIRSLPESRTGAASRVSWKRCSTFARA